MERKPLDAVGRCILKLYTILRNLIQSIKNALQEAKDYSDARGDYIVEEGTSGIWTYRKWSSGVYEAWGKEQRSTAMTGSIGAGQYYGNITFNISALGFTDIISAQVTGQASGVYFGTKIESWGTSSIQVSSRASASTTATVVYIFDLKGLWKAFENVGGGNP